MTFPQNILLNQPSRKRELVQKFYENHHIVNRDIKLAKDEQKKLTFFSERLEIENIKIDLGIDLGCRGGALTKHLLKFGTWIGVDLDRNAVELANKQGVPCMEMDITTAIDFKDEQFDAVCLTEVLEHLPYPTITLSEIHRILKQESRSVFIGSVPLDYHLHRRFAVFRGKKLTGDPTHLRSFSFQDLDTLLRRYFEQVDYFPLRGTKTRHSWLPWEHFVRDIAWFAQYPKKIK